MDVFDLQASVKIDTTEASRKLDDLLAKAKELDQYLSKPHGINIGNGNSGSNPANYGSNGGNGFFLLPPASGAPGASGSAGNLYGASPFLLNPGSSSGNNIPAVTANNGTTVQMTGSPYIGMEYLGGVGVPFADVAEYAHSHIFTLSEETESNLRAQGDAYKEARKNGYKGSVTDWANGGYDLWSSLPHYSRQSTTSELGRDSKGGLQRRRNVVEDNVVPVVPEVDANAAADIAAQVGEVTIPVRVAVTEIVGTGTGGAEGGDSSSVAGAVNKLSNKLDHMTIQVGKKAFGRTVVDNSGRSLQNFLGASQQSAAGGYGWR